MDTIILASGSPRRRELLQKVKIPIKVIPPQVREEIYARKTTAEFVKEIARRKVEAIVTLFKMESPRWILGADTMIEIDDTCVGKPDGLEQAERILQQLSGKSHKVYTGLALLPEKDRVIDVRSACTTVKFKKLSEQEIQFYLASGEWAGAAGAYRIQERGGFFVESIRGSYSNVVGLPLETLYDMLRDNGYTFSKE